MTNETTEPNYLERASLRVASNLVEFIEKEALPHSGLFRDQFWEGFAELVTDLTPKNQASAAQASRAARHD